MYCIIEDISINTPLGIRFWDPVIDDQVRDSLRVAARPANARWPVIYAYRTLSDVYAFDRLPDIENNECPECNDISVSSPSLTKSYIIEVRDIRRRYVDVTFQIDLPLPYCGIYPSQIEGSPSRSSPKGFLLFPATTRWRPPWMMSVTAELWDISLSKPASHAVMRIITDEGLIWHGLADGKGRVSVFVPPPTLDRGFGGSPSGWLNKKSLLETTWEIKVEVLYSGNLSPLPGSDLPEYKSILLQPQGDIWTVCPDEGSPAAEGARVTALPALLEFGKETILRTGGLSKLVISPGNYSP